MSEPRDDEYAPFSYMADVIFCSKFQDASLWTDTNGVLSLMCLARAVLEHTALTQGSHATSSNAKLPPSIQLVLIEESLAQSAVGVVREIVYRAEERFVVLNH